MPIDQRAHVVYGSPFAKEEHDLPRLARAKDHFHLEGRAGVEACADPVRQTRLRERTWTLEGAVPSQEVTTIAAEGTRRRAAPRKGQPFAPRGVAKTVTRQNGAGLGVEARHDVTLMSRSRRTEQPLGIAEDAHPTNARTSRSST